LGSYYLDRADFIGRMDHLLLHKADGVGFFGGDIRHWLEHEAGLKFDQRNSLIVGLVMGFAVIAPIFSPSPKMLYLPCHVTLPMVLWLWVQLNGKP
jgi:ABC-type uncharacterized transport system permease subunit